MAAVVSREVGRGSGGVSIFLIFSKYCRTRTSSLKTAWFLAATPFSRNEAATLCESSLFPYESKEGEFIQNSRDSMVYEARTQSFALSRRGSREETSPIDSRGFSSSSSSSKSTSCLSCSGVMSVTSIVVDILVRIVSNSCLLELRINKRKDTKTKNMR